VRQLLAAASGVSQEGAMNQKGHIFVGELLFTTDNFLLRPADNKPFVDVDLSFAVDEQHFNHQQVSVLGEIGERAVTPTQNIPSLIAKKIVLQKDIAARAFDISRSETTIASLGSPVRENG
jgi:hypothetical protein